MHIPRSYEKYLKIIRGKIQRLLKKFLVNAEILLESFVFPGAAEPGGGGNGGMCPPPTFLKVKKVPFFLGLNAPFKERK
jgi:hypothetical protein